MGLRIAGLAILLVLSSCVNMDKPPAFLSAAPTPLACTSDSDCAPAACCHPSSCVRISDKPDCKGTMCTMDCKAGTMDCGAGRCACQKGRCLSVMSDQAK